MRVRAVSLQDESCRVIGAAPQVRARLVQCCSQEAGNSRMPASMSGVTPEKCNNAPRSMVMGSPMNRRHFIQSAASSLVVPSAVTLANTSVSTTGQRAADYFFFDERFAKARRLAAELADSSPLTPVQGDITDVWNAGLNRAARHSQLTIRGVTTESFHFCLKIMVSEQTRVNTRIARLDRDLFLWTMHTRT